MNLTMRDYFLHFLDRELLETQGAYDKILEDSINRDVRFILLNSTGDLILSASFLFESRYAFAVFKEFYSFFINGKFTIAITYDSLKKMISVKQEQYKGKEASFPNYFNDLWYVLAESGVILVPKKEDTTIYIADGMVDKLQHLEHLQGKRDIPFIEEAINNRGKKAITHHLFDSVYDKRNVSENDRDIINFLITELYIRSYMDYFDASIPTGLSCGIYEYDYLSDNYPLSDVSFWMKLYKQMGLYRFICTCKISMLEFIIESKQQQEFVHIVERWVSFHKKSYGDKRRNFSFYKLINMLPKFNEIVAEDMELYINRIQMVGETIIELNNNEGKEKYNMNSKEKTIFVVHGRNTKIKQALFTFLRSLNLKPLEWESAVQMTNKGTPTTLEVIKAGMENSKGIIVLFTGDDYAKLKEELWEVGEHYDFELQPRQNVLIEAGMSMALYPNSTIIVRVGKQREISDFAGINFINLTNQPEKRQAFISRLKTIGLEVDDSGSDWLSVGDFNI